MVKSCRKRQGQDMKECCVGTLEGTKSPVEDVYKRHSVLPFNEMAQQHRTGHKRNGGGA